MPTLYTHIESPLGPLLLTSDGDAITRSQIVDGDAPQDLPPEWVPDRDPFVEVQKQLDAYFEGRTRSFDVPLSPRGTPFQQRVWDALQTIPFGETCTYGDLARRIGQPHAAQAVGAANGRNPIAILIPCHRVVGADGSLTGYAGGLDRKRFLLRLEAEHSGLFAPS